MIKKPAGYDEAAAYTGESQQLPKGKYVCVIKQVATQTSKNGNEQFVILYDIAEGEYRRTFTRRCSTATRPRIRWAQNGAACSNRTWRARDFPGSRASSLRLSVPITLPSSGMRVTMRSRLIGKKFGGIFRRSQYEADNGNRPYRYGAVADSQRGRPGRSRGAGR